MKNYFNYIKESKAEDEVIEACIKKGYYKAIEKLPIKSFLEENFTSLPVKNVKEVMDFYNIKIDKITEVYAFLDGLFSKFEKKRSVKYPDFIIYYINSEVYVNYNEKTKYFYYDYDKIYSILKSEYGLNGQKINELIQCMVDEHLKLGVVTPVTLRNLCVTGG